MLAIRCSTNLLPAASGVAPSVLEALVAMLADDDLPPVRELRGDRAPATCRPSPPPRLTLIGRGVAFDENDALPFMSAATPPPSPTPRSPSHDLDGARRRLRCSVAAMTFTAVDGNAEAFSPLVEQATPFPGAREVCPDACASWSAGCAPARIQDPFALRALPQVHGVLLDALRTSRPTRRRGWSNARVGEPGLRVDPPAVAHHGGFHAAALTIALDGVRLATLAAARLARVRLGLLCEPLMTTLPPFLGDPTRPGASGVLALEYVAGSALGDLHLLAQPAATASVSVSRGVEEDASFASLAGRAALAAVPSLRTVVATELLAALRALRMRDRPVPAGWAGLVAATSTTATSHRRPRPVDAPATRVDAGRRRGRPGGGGSTAARTTRVSLPQPASARRLRPPRRRVRPSVAGGGPSAWRARRVVGGRRRRAGAGWCRRRRGAARPAASPVVAAGG